MRGYGCELRVQNLPKDMLVVHECGQKPMMPTENSLQGDALIVVQGARNYRIMYRREKTSAFSRYR